MGKKTKEDLRGVLGLPEDEPGVVNVLCYRGTIYGVYHKHDDAYAAGIRMFGESAFSFLDANIIRKRVE